MGLIFGRKPGQDILSFFCAIYATTWQETIITIMQPFIPMGSTTKNPKPAHGNKYFLQKTEEKQIRGWNDSSHKRGTFHRRLQPLNTEKRKVSCPNFIPITQSLQHSCYHFNTCATFPSSPFPFVITSLPHPFPSSPLPLVTTSLPHQFPWLSLPLVTTSQRHHFPSSPLAFVTPSRSHHTPFVTTSLPHHFPSSPLPSVTTSQSHHIPFVTTR